MLISLVWGGVKSIDTFYFVIDPHLRHPGLADRLKAIINAYNEAKKNGLKFKIVYKTPFLLEEYLLPASKDNNWIASYDDLEYKVGKTKFVNETKKWHLKASKGKQYHCYSYTGDIVPEVFSNSGWRWDELFSELFIPNEEIRQAVEATGLKPKQYNAIHLRFVNALENFEEGYCNSLETEEEKLRLINKCKCGIMDIVKSSRKEGVEKIVVFSDSARFLGALSDIPVITLDSSSIGHISFSNAHDQVVKTFVDFFVISRAKRVYSIRTDEMYQSSCFAVCAARAGNAEFLSIKL